MSHGQERTGGTAAPQVIITMTMAITTLTAITILMGVITMYNTVYVLPLPYHGSPYPARGVNPS